MRCGPPRTLLASCRTPLEYALQLVHLCAELESPKYVRAAMRWLARYLDESSPSLAHFRNVTQELAARQDH